MAIGFVQKGLALSMTWNLSTRNDLNGAAMEFQSYFHWY